MVLSSLFASLMAVCAWISFPVMDIAFTMQTFGVFLTLGVLGGKWGSISIFIYLLLGTVGLPVFTGFQGGIGVLLGVTGGYIWGFLLSGLVYWTLEQLGKGFAMGAGMLICYACGCAWFLVYAGSGVGLAAVILRCVVPYLIPDILKISLALSVSNRIGKQLRF